MTIEIETTQKIQNEYLLPGGNTITREDGYSVMRDSEGFLLGMGIDEKSVIRAVYFIYKGREIAQHLEEYVVFEDKGGES